MTAGSRSLIRRRLRAARPAAPGRTGRAGLLVSGVLAAVAALLLAGAALDPPPAAAATEADRCLGTTFAAIACTSGRFCRAVGEYFAHRGGQGRYCINGWNDADS